MKITLNATEGRSPVGEEPTVSIQMLEKIMLNSEGDIVDALEKTINSLKKRRDSKQNLFSEIIEICKMLESIEAEFDKDGKPVMGADNRLKPRVAKISEQRQIWRILDAIESVIKKKTGGLLTDDAIKSLDEITFDISIEDAIYLSERVHRFSNNFAKPIRGLINLVDKFIEVESQAKKEKKEIETGKAKKDISSKKTKKIEKKD